MSERNGRLGTKKKKEPVRYAVVGLGYISQAAVLPAFRHARENSRLTALVSSDATKLKSLGRKYGVKNLFHDDDYDRCLRSGEIDAVYIALPNNLHCDYTERAADAGIHVLCEKPMAVNSKECARMIAAAGKHDVRLMIAYRLHFEATNMGAVQLAQTGKLGDLRIFHSLFTMSVKEGNIRLQRRLGGGTLFDIGIYCINACRYLFRSEPYEVFAWSANNGEPRFREVDEMTSAIMRFPGERLATFTCSFGAADTAVYQLVGTKGDLRVDPSYELAEGLKYELRINGKKTSRSFPKRDQFAPELIYFSDCVLKGRTPEPSGEEGLADVRIIEAMLKSARIGKPVSLKSFEREDRPGPRLEMRRTPVGKQKLVHAERPSMAAAD